MNFIAAFLHLYMGEEETFWALRQLLHCEPHRMRGLYTPAMPMIMQCLYVFDALLNEVSKKVAVHLHKHKVMSHMYATRWFMTIFISTFSFDLVIRIWDAFMIEGWKIVFRVALALLIDAAQDIMTLDELGSIMELMERMPERHCGRTGAERLMKKALGVRITNQRLYDLFDEAKEKLAEGEA